MAFRKSTNAGARAAEVFKAASSHANESARKPNLLLKLFRGEIKLLLTFWTFFISLPLLGDMVFTNLVFPRLDLESSVGTASVFMWGTFMLVYGVIASVGLWRSAKNYTGHSIWAVLAQACSVAGICVSVAYALMWYSSWMILTSA